MNQSTLFSKYLCPIDFDYISSLKYMSLLNVYLHRQLIDEQIDINSHFSVFNKHLTSEDKTEIVMLFSTL